MRGWRCNVFFVTDQPIAITSRKFFCCEFIATTERDCAKIYFTSSHNKASDKISFKKKTNVCVLCFLLDPSLLHVMNTGVVVTLFGYQCRCFFTEQWRFSKHNSHSFTGVNVVVYEHHISLQTYATQPVLTRAANRQRTSQNPRHMQASSFNHSFGKFLRSSLENFAGWAFVQNDHVAIHLAGFRGKN